MPFEIYGHLSLSMPSSDIQVYVHILIDFFFFFLVDHEIKFYSRNLDS
jgi:hypothetical protein